MERAVTPETSVTAESLYCYRRHLPQGQRLTIAYLREYLTQTTIDAAWISLEPRACLPELDGQLRPGRMAGLAVLGRRLPDGLDTLPLLSASLYGKAQWIHLHDAHPLSQLPGQIVRWSLTPIPDEDVQPEVIETHTKTHDVLPWRDRHRFGLPNDEALPDVLHVQHFTRHGRRITWRLLPAE